jgi:Uma2 family endonuclease
MNDHELAMLDSPEDLATPDTSDDLPPVPRGAELIDGRVVEKNLSNLAAYVGGRILVKLTLHVDAQKSGWLFGSEGGYRCFPDRPRTVRKPDVSFIRLGRLPGEQPSSSHARITPDLAVEVVSPNDLYNEVDVKISEYLDAGVPMVWVVNPEARTAHVYRHDSAVRRLRENDEIDGGDVLPGFRCRIGDFFLPASTAPASEAAPSS